MERGRLADALKHLEMASSADPRRGRAGASRAAFERAGNTEAAARQWQSVWSSTEPTRQGLSDAAPASGTAADRAAAAAVMRAAYERLLAKERAGAAPVDSRHRRRSRHLFERPIVGDAATAEGFAHIAEARYDDALARCGGAGRESRSHVFTRGRETRRQNRVGEARREFEAAVAGTCPGAACCMRASAGWLK